MRAFLVTKRIRSWRGSRGEGLGITSLGTVQYGNIQDHQFNKMNPIGKPVMKSL